VFLHGRSTLVDDTSKGADEIRCPQYIPHKLAKSILADMAVKHQEIAYQYATEYLDDPNDEVA